MNHDFYYDGRQIKNYLVGFASIFSEIPYQNRKGKLESVPIHYGSPSDIISYLEMNVDNAETANRNRLKDVSVPLFSFRMTSMERNVEKRRAPLDSITVDLRSLGYSTGYTTMKPAPFRFNFELLLWASSDYQAFEIVEQIVPYFNSPQQVTIEPLPKCPVSTTEVFLESFEIDTEPNSQKYSALVTMTFNLTGWLLAQPRIWSSNMKFELSMLDKENINNGVNLDDTDYSVGHEIIDNNIKPRPKSKEAESLETIENFITKTELSKIYGDKLDWYNELVNAGRISPNNGQILDTSPLIIDYKGVEKSLFLETMELLIDDMEDVKYLFTNEKLRLSLQSHTITEDVEILGNMYDDETETISTYLTLLDNNLVTKGFNRTNVPISNTDKLNMFGTPRVDIDLTMERMKTYLAGIENLKLKKEQIENIENFNNPFSIFIYDIKLPLVSIPDEFKLFEGNELDYIKTEEFKIIKAEYNEEAQKVKLRIKKNLENDSELSKISLIYFDETSNIKTETKEIEYNFDSTFDIEFHVKISVSSAFNIIPITENPGFNIKGIYIQDNRFENNDQSFYNNEYIGLNGLLYNKESEQQYYIEETIESKNMRSDLGGLRIKLTKLSDKLLLVDDNLEKVELLEAINETNLSIETLLVEIKNSETYRKYPVVNDGITSIYFKDNVAQIIDNIDFIYTAVLDKDNIETYVDNYGDYYSNTIKLEKNETDNRIFKVYVDEDGNKFYSTRDNIKTYIEERLLKPKDPENLEKFDIFDMSIPSNKNIMFEPNYFEIFNQQEILDTKFLDMDEYIISTLLYSKYVKDKIVLGYSDDSNNPSLLELIRTDKLYKIFYNKFGKTVEEMIALRNNLFKTLYIVSTNVDSLKYPEEIGVSDNEAKEGQKTIAPDLAVVLSLDKSGNPIYDINGDGYIDIEDLKLLGADVDNPEDYDFEIKYGVWHKRFRPENMTEDRVVRISQDLKIIYYLTEKEDMSELKDYLIMWDKGLLSDGFDIFDDKKKQNEIKALGYDLVELDNKLLFFRLFVTAIRNIMITERDFILYKVPDMNSESKELLYQTEGLNMDKIVMAKFIDRYFKLSKNEDESMLDERLFRGILPNTMGDYFSHTETFNLMWFDIKQTDFFKDSLNAYTPWLDEQLPEVTEKINNVE